MTAQQLIDALSALTPEQKQLYVSATYDCGRGLAGVDWIQIAADQIYLCELHGTEPQVPRGVR